MERIAKFAKTIRNNWKKSVVGVIALYYGGATLKEKYEINVLMQAACKEAALYGDALIPMERNPTMVTVILNPVANKRKAKRDFEQYCEPLLHLAGLQVNVIQTASEGNAKDIVETLHGTEAIIVAGGDGTLSETVTGLLRRNDDANQFPLGVIPLGSTNTFGNSLFPGGKGSDKVKQLIEACMAIIKGDTDWKDAIKIEPITTDEETPSRPIYAVSSVEYGAFRDTLAKKDKYWFYGSLRDYAMYIFNGYKNSLTWECNGTIRYTPPCAGCSNCVVAKKKEVRKVWSLFMSNTIAAESKQLSNNPECMTTQELCYKTSDFRIQTENKGGLPVLSVILGKPGYTYTEFVAEGWNRLKNIRNNTFVIPVRTVELLPVESEKEVMIEIDREEFELKPVKVTLLPKIIKLFCTPQSQIQAGS